MKKKVRQQMVRIQSLAGKAKVPPAKVKPRGKARSNCEDALALHAVYPVRSNDDRLDLLTIIEFIRKLRPAMAEVLKARLAGLTVEETAKAMRTDDRHVYRLLRSAGAIIRGSFQGMFAD